MTRPTLTLLAVAAAVMPATAQDPVDLNDLEMAHAAVTASNIDIAYAHLALAFSETPAIREFAQTMIRDHSAVNEQVFALARRLGVQAQDNAFSRGLLEQAAGVKDEMSRLRGPALDRFYIENEARYHQTVNGVVADAFIPNIDNPDVRSAFEGALTIFRGHQGHAERLVRSLGPSE
jgi:putative membrane protein